ncbi:hypothetical protein LX36DRAFT_145333 [Colletotrichum falcatum]|nr:hypothetical protein LX36DRAFT_145333 [Colletotrichum falcatum]
MVLLEYNGMEHPLVASWHTLFIPGFPPWMTPVRKARRRSSLAVERVDRDDRCLQLRGDLAGNDEGRPLGARRKLYSTRISRSLTIRTNHGPFNFDIHRSQVFGTQGCRDRRRHLQICRWTKFGRIIFEIRSPFSMRQPSSCSLQLVQLNLGCELALEVYLLRDRFDSSVLKYDGSAGPNLRQLRWTEPRLSYQESCLATIV